MSVYLYGVVRKPFPRASELPAGVGDPPGTVELLRYRNLAAVATETPEDRIPGLQVQGMRRDMTAHAMVVERLFEQTTILPMRFGVVLPDRETVIHELLEAEQDRFDELLSELKGCVELTLRATYVEEVILREVAQEQPSLARRERRSTRPSRDARIEQGCRVAQTLRDKGEHDARRLLQRLTPLARDVLLEEPSSELMLLNAAFLVERETMALFDKAVEAFYDENEERMRLEYVGPLAPYSFSRIQLPIA
jgi:hypothetical protein